MEFLVTYMTNTTTGNMSTENPSSDQNLIQPEDLINYQEDEFAHNESFGRELHLILLATIQLRTL